MRKLLLWLCLAAPALAQSNYLTITTNSANEIIQGPSSTGLVQGTFCAYATDLLDRPIAFEVGGVYQAAKGTTCVPVVNGQFSGTLTLANPAATAPLYLRYHVTVTNTLNNTSTQYPGVLIVTSGSTWDWASWNPSQAVTGFALSATQPIVGPSIGVYVNGSLAGILTKSAVLLNNGLPAAQAGPVATQINGGVI